MGFSHKLWERSLFVKKTFLVTLVSALLLGLMLFSLLYISSNLTIKDEPINIVEEGNSLYQIDDSIIIYE